MERMISCSLCVLICYLMTLTAGEPSCEGVPDFGGCRGDVAGFCPKSIECSCKSGHAFCSCPYYKGPNADYWYLGEKCDRLWSTWDLVAVSVFPGVALAFVVGVTAQLIHFCKTSPKSKAKKEKKGNNERKISQSHQNRAFMPEEQSRNSRYVDVPLSNVSAHAPQKTAAAWNIPAPQPQKPLNRMSSYLDAENRTRGYEDPKPQKFQRSGWGYPEQDYDSRDTQAPQRAAYEEPRTSQSYGRGFPEQDYDFSDRQAPQQFSRSGAPPLPQADYGWGRPEPESSGTGWNGRSFSFGRPQLKSNYDY